MDYLDEIMQFMSITGADMDTAKHLLEASDYNLQKATNLYFEGVISSPNLPPPTRQQPTQQHIPPEEYVRPPIPQKAQKLFEDEESQKQLIQKVRVEGFPRDMPQYMRDMLGFPGQPSRTPKTKTEDKFDRLFAEPKKILFKGTLEEAIDEARKKGRWLIANLQSPSEFDALRLNRDTWSNDLVQMIITTFFVFWQVAIENPEGKRFKDFYGIEKVPSICIINPRTSEIVKRWDGYRTPEQMSDALSEWAESKKIEPPKESQPTIEIPEEQLDEEEMIRRAIQASLEEATFTNTHTKSDSPMEIIEEEPQKKKQEKKVYTDYKPFVTTEVEGSTRIQLRFPDGSRKIERVKLTTPLSAIYCMFQEGLKEEDKHRDIQVIFLDKKLENDPNVTLLDRKITNASLSITFND